jgi:hypothetical protein
MICDYKFICDIVLVVALEIDVEPQQSTFNGCSLGLLMSFSPKNRKSPMSKGRWL